MREETIIQHIRKYYILLAISVTIIIGIVIAPAVYSQSVAIDNTPPVVLTAQVATTEFGSEAFDYSQINTLAIVPFRALHITGDVIDPNGFSDIEQIRATFFRGDLKNGNECGENPLKCYRVEYCTIKPTRKSTTAKYDCAIDIKSWIPATDEVSTYASQSWQIDVVAIDDNGAESVLSQQRDIASSLHLYIKGSLDFGSIKAGYQTTSESNVLTEIQQLGTTPARIIVNGTDLVCNTWNTTIPVDHLKWSTTDVSFSDELATSLSGLPTNTEIRLPDPELKHPAKQVLYWNLAVPPSIRGECGGTIEISAQQDDLN